jgi:hypothetical protein
MISEMVKNELKRTDLEFGDYIVYRKLIADADKISTELVVVDDQKKADEYMKWLFGKDAGITITPSYEHDNYMLMEVHSQYKAGYGKREYIPVGLFKENMFWKVIFRKVIKGFIVAELESESERIPLSDFYELIAGPDAVLIR